MSQNLYADLLDGTQGRRRGGPWEPGRVTVAPISQQTAQSMTTAALAPLRQQGGLNRTAQQRVADDSYNWAARTQLASQANNAVNQAAMPGNTPDVAKSFARVQELSAKLGKNFNPQSATPEQLVIWNDYQSAQQAHKTAQQQAMSGALSRVAPIINQGHADLTTAAQMGVGVGQVQAARAGVLGQVNQNNAAYQQNYQQVQAAQQQAQTEADQQARAAAASAADMQYQDALTNWNTQREQSSKEIQNLSTVKGVLDNTTYERRMAEWHAAHPQPKPMALPPVAPSVAPQMTMPTPVGQLRPDQVVPVAPLNVAGQYVGPVNGAEQQTPDYARMDGQRAAYYRLLDQNSKAAGMGPTEYVDTMRSGPMGQAAIGFRTEDLAGQRRLQEIQAQRWALDTQAMAAQHAAQRAAVNPVAPVPVGQLMAGTPQQVLAASYNMSGRPNPIDPQPGDSPQLAAQLSKIAPLPKSQYSAQAIATGAATQPGMDPIKPFPGYANAAVAPVTMAQSQSSSPIAVSPVKVAPTYNAASGSMLNMLPNGAVGGFDGPVGGVEGNNYSTLNVTPTAPLGDRNALSQRMIDNIPLDLKGNTVGDLRELVGIEPRTQRDVLRKELKNPNYQKEAMIRGYNLLSPGNSAQAAQWAAEDGFDLKTGQRITPVAAKPAPIIGGQNPSETDQNSELNSLKLQARLNQQWTPGRRMPQEIQDRYLKLTGGDKEKAQQLASAHGW